VQFQQFELDRAADFAGIILGRLFDLDEIHNFLRFAGEPAV